MTEQATLRMIAHNHGDARRIAHSVKVHGYAQTLGLLEGLDGATQQVLELAAILHDVGIRPAEEKYGSAAGPLQEKEGEPLARAHPLTHLELAAEAGEHAVAVFAGLHRRAGAGAEVVAS